MKIGITERGDAALDQSWRKKLDKLDGIILITKAPHLLGEIPPKSIVHCTITGCGGTDLEPNVAPPVVTLEAYHDLVNKYGGQRIVLRIDPIIPIEPYLSDAFIVRKEARGRVRLSFMDTYPHVRKRFESAGINIPWEGLHAPYELRKEIFDKMQPCNDGETLDDVTTITVKPDGTFEFPQELAELLSGIPKKEIDRYCTYCNCADLVTLEVCAEPGLVSSGCVSQKDLDAAGIEGELKEKKWSQRKLCNCIAEKIELLTNSHRCPHTCLYCYWKDEDENE